MNADSKNIEATAPTPLISQYMRVKAEYPNYILMFRIGDFYEMLNDDAQTASEVLNIALTRKMIGKGKKSVPLAGVPFHSVDGYLAKLIRAGKKVAICEQMEDPKKAKGLVKRDVVRVVTPGTVIEDNLLSPQTNNFLVSLFQDKNIWGVAIVDLSTGAFAVTEFDSRRAKEELFSEINRLQPAELLVPESIQGVVSELLGTSSGTLVTPLEDRYFEEGDARALLCDLLKVQSLHGFGAEHLGAAVSAAGAIARYLRETQKTALSHINRLQVYSTSDFMILDYTTQRSLELAQNLQGGREATLLSVMDKTITAMGARLLRNWILQPLKEKTVIEERLAAVQEIYDNTSLREGLEHHLRRVFDLERIMARVGCRSANAKDLLALRLSLEQIPPLKALLARCANPLFLRLSEKINPLDNLRDELALAIQDNPPYMLRDGNIFRDGYNGELDELRGIMRDTKGWINQLRQKEIERTGYQNLKIGFNQVFGYYIEITRASLKNGPPLPAEYIRKQTLFNAERYITPELKEKEEIVLNADERSKNLEFALFEALRDKVGGFTREIQELASAVALLDCLSSNARIAIAGRYVRPEIGDDGRIEIFEGRHPVLEAVMTERLFIPNDTQMNTGADQIMLITGPNMAGKSTYIRQVALITLMAHTGSFVPAKKAHIGIVDRIFTRVGAMDYITKGLSTFLVEMNETANILNNATSNSLVILDEIGRGTSTYDGLSIAWAVIEYLHNKSKKTPKTLFATHYHELTNLEGKLPRLKNYNAAVLEKDDKITFLYKIIKGSTDHSYGIYAAQLAGVPEDVVSRAKEILFDLECGNTINVEVGRLGGKRSKGAERAIIQLSLFDGAGHPAIERLKNLDVSNLTPLQALTILDELVRQCR
ncbi:MAG TPA: DNA mismatch repair protein MutS [Candidatus Sumerlaeota bacterium]|nr:MAG: DNA mismatch repair protein MutS [candidate division BRC1 bacterium ADurb.Bin183]HOE63793.1 DNA mismatch repair protein MutS [Candidatus Sumerlaeota bacterium]HRR30095.1 DNA mismatch repair protein MutS [Candidatus Sumerlaeia bacterium]HON49756.1 DNA mismatch repair protein MutS [Candidatus Sumerlaeota bacterium]HOR63996.1 DNA mismatch repair protein MutS [Candidatus Sumerlaeota bacterium]